ncbi:hypothetical protein ACQP3J_32965, partial [Escherichia coli]
GRNKGSWRRGGKGEEKNRGKRTTDYILIGLLKGITECETQYNRVNGAPITMDITELNSFKVNSK